MAAPPASGAVGLKVTVDSSSRSGDVNPGSGSGSSVSPNSPASVGLVERASAPNPRRAKAVHSRSWWAPPVRIRSAAR
jgi:hypothetical protein